MTDYHFMKRAIELAKIGLGRVSPNPMVGCVIVKNDKILGESYHKAYGESHAEANAINLVQEKKSLKGSTIYLTLEPCNHFGNTPPCTHLLIDHQVKKVIIATQDPHKKVNGKGIEYLRKNNIDVELGLLDKQAKALNKRFFTYHICHRPYIILKWAQTSDGFIAKDNYDSKWISNQYSRQLVHKWRSEEDAVLVGYRTIKYDNPSLTTRSWIGKNPTRVVLNRNVTSLKDRKIFDNTSKTIILHEKNMTNDHDHLFLKCSTWHPKIFMKKLYEQNIQSVIVEGGSKTLKSFIENNYWDEARVFTNEKKFNSGIKSPEFYHPMSMSKKNFDDYLTIHYNHEQASNSI